MKLVMSDGRLKGRGVRLWRSTMKKRGSALSPSPWKNFRKEVPSMVDYSKKTQELLEQILRHLDGVKEYKGYYMARCPEGATYHTNGDRTPSLKISKNGWYRCFNPNCPLHEGGHITKLAQMLGIEVEEEYQGDSGLQHRAIDYIAQRLKLPKDKAQKFMARFNIRPYRYRGTDGVLIDLFNGAQKFRSFESKTYHQFGKGDNPAFADLIGFEPGTGGVVVTEGTFDALSLWAHGTKAISTEGEQHSIEKVAEWLKEHGIGTVILAFDNDEAGRAKLDKAIGVCMQKGIIPFVFDPSPYKDVNEVLVNEGVKGLEQKLMDSKQVFDWIASRFNLEDPIGRHNAFVKMVVFYERASNKPTAENLVKETLGKYGLAYDEWFEELERIAIHMENEKKKQDILATLRHITRQIEEGQDIEAVAHILREMLDKSRQIDVRTIDEDPDLLLPLEGSLKYNLLPDSVSLYRGDLLLISAPTKTGKTTYALNLFKEALDDGQKAVYITYELNKRTLFTIFVGLVLGKHFEKVTEQDKEKVRSMYAKRAVIMDNLGLEDIIACIKFFRPDIFIVDYDQMVKTTGRFESEERRVSHIVRTLKSLSVETQSVCVLLSQENEEGSARWSREKEFFASVHLHLEKKDDDIMVEVKLNRYGYAGEKASITVDWKTRSITYTDSIRPL
jgi:KaiC/GvpD/RAD55 family RecA-like ATPase